MAYNTLHNLFLPLTPVTCDFLHQFALQSGQGLGHGPPPILYQGLEHFCTECGYSRMKLYAISGLTQTFCMCV